MKFIILLMGIGCTTNNKTNIGEEIEDTNSNEIVDADNDGYFSDEDCDDLSSNVNPGVPELCDGIDNNCDGNIDENVIKTFYADSDGDGFGDNNITLEGCEAPSGYTPISNDCDDNNNTVYPGANEECDGLDNDCDDIIDNANNGYWYPDLDGDGYGAEQDPVIGCAPDSTWVSVTGDCNDENPAVNPFGIEECDTLDNDCDGYTDEGLLITFYLDSDNDGFGDASTTVDACTSPEGYISNGEDCDDSASDIYPTADEYCDEIDNNCDGVIDESSSLDAIVYYQDSDGDTYGNPSITLSSCSQPSGYVSNNEDCNDQNNNVYPTAPELCVTSIDDDCDGQINEDDAIDKLIFYLDTDNDGHGGTQTESCTQPSGGYLSNTDCDDSNANVYQGATEICNLIDDDCDGDIDDDDSSLDTTTGEIYYFDLDQDGYGTNTSTITACLPPNGYVATGGDCDESNNTIHPNATLLCDGTDNDCDGNMDNDLDGDGYPAATCGGTDCDDSDATVLPELNGGCALGANCLEVLNNGYSIGDGTYTIDPDGFASGLDPFDVYCDMTTDGGGWTEIAYDADLPFAGHFTGGDQWIYLPNDFSFVLSDDQISAIQQLSTEGQQEYVGLCEHVIHHYYNDGGDYAYAFGFMYFDGSESDFGVNFNVGYPEIDVVQDGCATNGSPPEGGSVANATIFSFSTPLLPIRNVLCRDCGNNPSINEFFGSPLTENSAWLRQSTCGGSAKRISTQPQVCDCS